MIFRKYIEKIYKNNIYVRCDDTKTVFYFSSEDFDGLRKRDFDFSSYHGHRLCGSFYYYDNFISDRIVIFDHGHGGGHRAYMKEIELLAKEGYLVFSYDHTGCMLSGGESSNGLAQSLADLNDCICALKKCGAFDNYTFSVVGHSWGGYAVLNIAALHPDIKHIIPISGFISVKEMIRQSLPGLLIFWRKDIFRLEKRTNPDFAGYCATDVLKNTDAHVLFVYSEDDGVVKKKYHYDILFKKLQGRKNTGFTLEKEKGHNPNYTTGAVKCKDRLIKELSVFRKKESTDEEKKEFISRFDWHEMTRQDEKVWEKIFETLKK